MMGKTDSQQHHDVPPAETTTTTNFFYWTSKSVRSRGGSDKEDEQAFGFVLVATISQQ